MELLYRPRIVYKVVNRFVFDTQFPYFYGSTIDEIKKANIHLSTWNQLPKTIAKKFREEKNAYLVSVDLHEFDRENVIWAEKKERIEGQQRIEHYPHVINVPITPDQIIWVKDLEIDSFTGLFEIGHDNFEKLLNKHKNC